MLQNPDLTLKLIESAKSNDLSWSFIEEIAAFIDFKAIETNPHTPENFLQSHSHRFNFRNVLLSGKKLSFDFIRSNPVALNRCWDLISAKIPLTEREMSEMEPLLDWKIASKFQKMSPAFIVKHKHVVDWYNIEKHQNVTKAFVSRYKPDNIY